MAVQSKMACTIEHLPNELLHEIFSFAGVTKYDEEDQLPLDTQGLTIRQLRLVCTLWAAVGARLLIPCITVAYTPRSLARLEAVSNSPIIRAGVRVVDFRIDFNDPIIASSLRVYADMKRSEFDAAVDIALEKGVWPLDGRDQCLAEDEADIFRDVCLNVSLGLRVPARSAQQLCRLKESFNRYRHDTWAQNVLNTLIDNPAEFTATAVDKFRGLRGARFNSHMHSRFPWAPCKTLHDVIEYERMPGCWELPAPTRLQERHMGAFYALFNDMTRQRGLHRVTGGVSSQPPKDGDE